MFLGDHNAQALPNRFSSAHVMRMKRASREKKMRIGTSEATTRNNILSVEAKQINSYTNSQSPAKNSTDFGI